MSFFVDIVSEDAFFENLTLGVSRQLEASPCVRNVQLERRGACDRASLSTWEQKHCCLLTEDLRNFYTSTDGFLLTWSLDIAGEEFPVGRMEIKDLASLKRHVGNGGKDQQADCSSSSSSAAGGSSASSSTSISTSDEASGKPNIVEPTFGGSRCKLFELAECDECKVFLAYQLQPDQDEPSVWLHNFATTRWYLLADSFVKYFRMMLVHLGLPMWQVCAAGLPLPTWIEQVYLLVGPHLLPSMHPQTIGPTRSIDSSLWNDGPTNLIDQTIFFRSKEHHHHHHKQKNSSSTTTTAGATGTTTATTTTTTATASSSNARKKSSSH